MKILLPALLLGALGAGSYALVGAGGPQSAPSPSPCDAEVSCTPDGRCVITCTKPDGSTCTVELECDGGACRVVDCAPQCAPQCAPACPPDCR